MEIFNLVFSPIEVNTYILADKSGDCAIIDCGCYNEIEFSKLTALLEKKSLTPVLLLNTHCHLDHIFGNRFMLEKYNLRAYCSREDDWNRLNAVNVAQLFGLEMEIPPDPLDYIADDQIVTFGESVLRAIHVPGHSKGSIAYYSEENDAVFTGDALFSGSIGRTDLPGGDYSTLIKSISTRLFSLPGKTLVYPGHGPSTTIEKEIKTNPYFN